MEDFHLRLFQMTSAYLNLLKFLSHLSITSFVTGWMWCLPQIHMLKSSPNMVVTRGGTFGRWVGQEGGDLKNGIRALIRRDQRVLLFFFCLERNTVRSQQSAAFKRTFLSSTLIMLAPWSQTTSLQNCEKYISIDNPPNLWYFALATKTKTLFPAYLIKNETIIIGF